MTESSEVTVVHTTHTELDNDLGEFYSKYPGAIDAEEWMEKHEYHEAIADDATEEWMSE